MKYYSTNHQASDASLGRKAVVKGLASDKGLYMPEAIKPLPQEFYMIRLRICRFRKLLIAWPMLSSVRMFLLKHEADRFYDTLSFDVPAVKVKDNIYSFGTVSWSYIGI